MKRLKQTIGFWLIAWALLDVVAFSAAADENPKAAPPISSPQPTAKAEPFWGLEFAAPKEQGQVLSAVKNLSNGGSPTAWLGRPLVVGPGLWNVLRKELGMPAIGKPSSLVIPGQQMKPAEMGTLITEADLRDFGGSRQFRSLMEAFAEGLVLPATSEQRQYLQVEVPFSLKGTPVSVIRRGKLVLLAIVSGGKLSWIEALVKR
jgi:hypothetical protein